MLSDKTDLLLNHIIKYSFDEIFVIDHEGNIILASGSFKKFFDIHYKDVINQNIYALEKQGILEPFSITGKVLETKKIETIIQNTPVGRRIVVTGYPIFNEIDEIVGAISFSRDITELDYLKQTNEQVARTIKQYEKERKGMKQNQSSVYREKNIEMNKVFHMVEKVSNLAVTVLLAGESGVGKNYIAKKIHEKSNRRQEPFVEINCGAIPESLIESELFGYVEGAFTGAKKGGKEGYFESAANGTIFLDEISELPLHLQVKLLSVLQNLTIQRVGGSEVIHLNCRIICATNQDLEKLIREKKFREDLYYRINVIKMTIPPLRERKEDIRTLADQLLEEFNQKYSLNKSFSQRVYDWLVRQEWPGNIRELRNFIERTIIISNKDMIELEEIGVFVDENDDVSLEGYMERVEGAYIKEMYEKHPSSIQLAKALQISQSTANRKINKYVNLD